MRSSSKHRFGPVACHGTRMKPFRGRGRTRWRRGAAEDDWSYFGCSLCWIGARRPAARPWAPGLRLSRHARALDGGAGTLRRAEIGSEMAGEAAEIDSPPLSFQSALPATPTLVDQRVVIATPHPHDMAGFRSLCLRIASFPTTRKGSPLQICGSLVSHHRLGKRSWNTPLEYRRAQIRRSTAP